MSLYKKSFSIILALIVLLQSNAATAATPPPSIPFLFNLMPKVIETKEHHHSHIILTAVLAPSYNAPGSYIEAYRKDHQTHFLYSKPFLRFIKSKGLKKSQFSLMKKYLKKQLQAAKKDPLPYITYLDTYVHSATPKSYTVDIHQSESSTSSSSSSQSTPLLEAPTVFTFLTVPEVIKVSSHNTKVSIAGVLPAAYGALPGAQIEAHQSHGRTRYTYSNAMKKYMKAHGLTKSAFKPLQDYLKAQITLAKASPAKYVSYLDSYVHGGPVPPFTFAIQLPVVVEPSSVSFAASRPSFFSTSS